MKIRSGFVSNSSSTSFLIIAKNDLTEASFLKLMGIEKSSPMKGLFQSLYKSVIDGVDKEVDFSKTKESSPVESFFPHFESLLTQNTLKKLEDARQKKLKVYAGRLSSDNNTVETFFCCDAFEAENEQMYINALECAW